MNIVPTNSRTVAIGPEAPLDSDSSRGELPFVCAYVITYNGKRFLERCFQTLRQRTDDGNDRLFLVDNGSSDGSGDYVREHFPEVEVLRVFPNRGYSHGANAAVEDARRRGAKYVVLMNDDIAILHSHWLREAISRAERDPSIGIVGFVSVPSEHGQHVAPSSKLTDVDYLQSAILVMPLELFDRIGMFDEVYYVVGDEDDLGTRAQAAGYRIAKLGIPILHFGGCADQSYSRGAAYLQMRNGIRFCLKNRSSIHALLRAVRIIDVACNPWPVTFDSRDVAHRRMRNSGNVFVNLFLWLRAVTWNIVRLPQTFQIRAAERRHIREASAARRNADLSTRSAAKAVHAETSQLTPACIGDRT